MQRTRLAALVCGLFSLPAVGQEIATLSEIVVTSMRVPTPELAAPYALEVHTRQRIEQSGATSLYDYLAHHSSVNVMPSYGNRYTPWLDMRGYGLGDGYQNLVVSVDGRRLNNIDLSPQWLGMISLADVERIEIVKGSGAVPYGDGSMAGGIHIVTRPQSGLRLTALAGNHGAQDYAVHAGVLRDAYTLALSGLYEHVDGYAEPDVTGHRDASGNRLWRGLMEIKPLSALTLGLELSSARIDTRYPGPLTLAEFSANPAQNGGNTYNHQKLDSDLWQARAAFVPAPGWEIRAAHAREDKRSAFLTTWPSRADYDYVSDDIALAHKGLASEIVAGWQRFDGVRIGSNDRTHKDNSGVYLQANYRLGATTLAAGARREWVDYVYAPTARARLAASHRLHAWDLGFNHQLDPALSVFANVARAFQAPDIDRFFTYDPGTGSITFNDFIAPAVSRTLSVGVNHATAVNRLKLSGFYAKLNDEIYFNPLTFSNTNLDKTHKYGLELQDVWQIRPWLAARLNYTWTRAVIDRENDGGGAYDGKDLPGVPRHSARVGLDWQPFDRLGLQLAHTWRSQAYALEDFANAFNQRQRAYRSTDLALRYRLKHLEVVASVENLFRHSNGLWVRDDAIYPVNFTRNWRVGLKAAF